MHGLRYEIAAEAGRLLRLLLVRLGAVPAGPGGAWRRSRRRGLLFRVGKAAGVAANLRHGFWKVWRRDVVWLSHGRGLVLGCQDGVDTVAANVTKRLWEIGDIVDVLKSWKLVPQRGA